MLGLFYFACITAVFIWLIYLQLIFKISCRYNLASNSGMVIVKLFGISIIKSKISIININLKTNEITLLVNKKEVVSKLTPKIDKESIFNYIALPIFYMVDFVVFNIYIEFGYSRSAFTTMSIVQLLRSALISFVSIIKSSQPLDANIDVMPNFCKDTIRLDFDGIITASIANIICSIVHAKCKKEKQRSKTI